MRYFSTLSFLGLLALAACGDAATDTHTSSLSAAECAALGGQAIWDPGDGSVHQAGCPKGQTLLGTLPGFEGGICCGPSGGGGSPK